MDVTTEKLILSSLARNEEYVRKVLPYIKPDYFQDKIEQTVFNTIHAYLTEYNSLPNKTTLLVDIKDSGLGDNLIGDAESIIRDLFDVDSNHDEKWLIKQTEEFCQNKAVYNAIMKAIGVYDGTEKDITTHAIPDIIKDAIGVSFDTHIGMDFLDDAEARWDYYTNPENKVPFNIAILNEVTDGGVIKRTLNMLVAGINSGKSMGLVHLACDYARLGYDVLYISMEMREEEILKRVDANMLKVAMNSLKNYSKDDYMNKVNKLKEKSYGKIKVKEFPPNSAHTGHFKHMLAELKMKQRFSPAVIIVDYLGIVSSSRLKTGQHNSYTYLKSVSEELRALAVETDTVLWSAMQLNRQGISSSDVEMTDISDSMGIPASADLMIGMTRTEELDSLGQILFKQLKSRYSNKTNKLRFVVGVDLEKQTLYDVNQSEQVDILQPVPAHDALSSSDNKSLRDKFLSFKV